MNQFDDILPPQENAQSSDTSSIRALHIQSKERSARRERRAERRQTLSVDPHEEKSGGVSIFSIATVTIAVLAVIGVGAGFLLFQKTTVSITPHSENITLSDTAVFTAYNSPEGDELGFTTYTNTFEASENIPASETTYVERYASGTITVYNNFDGNSQRLIKNTRFQAADGAIYRVRNSIVVPGKSGNTPGSIDVTVYADVAGEAYNLQTGRFTIPGLEGDARFDAFYAEVKTPITGGFVGDEPSVAPEDIEAARTALRAQLEQQVVEGIGSQISATTTAFATLQAVAYDSDQRPSEDGASLQVIERITVEAPVFNAADLARTLLETAVASPRDGAVAITDYTPLRIAPADGDIDEFVDAGIVQFTVAGSTNVLWQIDSQELANNLAGSNQTQLTSIAETYPGIKTASATIRPFWSTSFPSNTENIEITIQETE